MRIIGGDLKSRSIDTLESYETRPTSNQTREAIFNLLGQEFSGGLGLDLFAGSGALGIEALSRGLDKMIFVDKNSEAIAVINKNLKSLELTERAQVVHQTAQMALDSFSRQGLTFNLIFIDPPYDLDIHEETIQQLSDLDLLADKFFIIVETDKRKDLAEEIAGLQKWKDRRYGKARISIYH